MNATLNEAFMHTKDQYHCFSIVHFGFPLCLQRKGTFYNTVQVHMHASTYVSKVIVRGVIQKIIP